MTKEEELLRYQQRAAAGSSTEATTPAATSSFKTPEAERNLWASRWRDAAEKLATRGDFKYNPNDDPMYQNYREQYARNGRLAMADTIGTAAANNGGYGTSYGQMAGQQAYSGYMQGLNDKYPELYQAALSRYQQAGEQLQTRMNLAGQMRTAAPQAAAAMQGGWGSSGGTGWSGTGGKTSGVDSSATLLALKGLNAGGYTSGEILQALQDYGYSAAQAETALRNATSMKNIGSAVGSAVSGAASGVGNALGKLFYPITNAYNKTTGAKKK